MITLAQMIPLPHSPWEFYGLLIMLIANLIGTYLNAFFSRKASIAMNGKVTKLLDVSESYAFTRGELAGAQRERAIAELKASTLIERHNAGDTSKPIK